MSAACCWSIAEGVQIAKLDRSAANDGANNRITRYARIMGAILSRAWCRPGGTDTEGKRAVGYLAACGSSSGLDPPRNSRFPSLNVMFAPLARSNPFLA